MIAALFKPHDRKISGSRAETCESTCQCFEGWPFMKTAMMMAYSFNPIRNHSPTHDCIIAKRSRHETANNKIMFWENPAAFQTGVRCEQQLQYRHQTSSNRQWVLCLLIHIQQTKSARGCQVQTHHDAPIYHAHKTSCRISRRPNVDREITERFLGWQDSYRDNWKQWECEIHKWESWSLRCAASSALEYECKLKDSKLARISKSRPLTVMQHLGYTGWKITARITIQNKTGPESIIPVVKISDTASLVPGGRLEPGTYIYHTATVHLIPALVCLFVGEPGTAMGWRYQDALKSRERVLS